MSAVELTHPSLLVRIRNLHDHTSWSDFVNLYTPMIYRFTRQQGLQDSDAAVVTQDVLVTVARTIHKFEYDARRGSFRNWLKVVTRSRLSDFFAAQKRHPPGSGETGIDLAIREHAVPSNSDEWEHEYRQSLFDVAADRIRCEFEESTWQAFWRTSVDGVESAIVAEQLGVSIGAVYIARSRVLARLRRAVVELDC